jgi:hypothetical protein
MIFDRDLLFDWNIHSASWHSLCNPYQRGRKEDWATKRSAQLKKGKGEYHGHQKDPVPDRFLRCR